MLVLVMLVRPFVSRVFLFFVVALLACNSSLVYSSTLKMDDVGHPKCRCTYICVEGVTRSGNQCSWHPSTLEIR
jgi:hypothetical protein